MEVMGRNRRNDRKLKKMKIVFGLPTSAGPSAIHQAEKLLKVRKASFAMLVHVYERHEKAEFFVEPSLQTDDS